MSRHKLIKQLDLDEELGDYDGGSLYDNDEDEGSIIPLSSMIAVNFADFHLLERDQYRRSRYFIPDHNEWRVRICIYCTDLWLRQSERLRQGTIRVRDVLGPGFGISDAKIQESLWHYYYDVEKSVNYILSS